jgi:hypothetical protein
LGKIFAKWQKYGKGDFESAAGKGAGVLQKGAFSRFAWGEFGLLFGDVR